MMAFARGPSSSYTSGMGEILNTLNPTFSDAAWIDVIRKMDATYSELLKYQVELEEKNSDLEGMRAFIESVLGSMTDILIACNLQNQIVQTNAALVRSTGISAQALKGLRVTDLFAENDRDKLVAMLSAAATKMRTQRLELTLQTQDTPEILDIHAAPRTDPRGRVVGIVLIGRPIGELRRAYVELNSAHEKLIQAQEQLVHSEKMASLGRLVSGVAHEINNPISFVYGNAHALERYVGRLETYFQQVQNGAPRADLIELREKLKVDKAVGNLREAIAGALEGAERVRDIVESLRRFSADGHGEAQPFDLVGITRTALAWVIKGHEPRLRATLSTPERVIVEGRSGHIQQVLMNMIQNACDSMENRKDGVIDISISQDHDHAVLKIGDQGPGMTPEAMLRMFDPFFTTKPVGKGIGLGLSISYRIVQQHGGTLTPMNKPDGGAMFEMRLPLRWRGASEATA